MAEEKYGAGHAKGMLRKGFKEIAPTLKAFPDSISSPEETGVFGNLTQKEIQETKGKETSHEEWLKARAKETEREPEPPEDEMER
jgi:hypothetical protein